MRNHGRRATADDGSIDPDLDGRDLEDVGIRKLRTHLSLDGFEIGHHGTRTIKIDRDARGHFSSAPRNAAGLGRMSEGGQQG